MQPVAAPPEADPWVTLGLFRAGGWMSSPWRKVIGTGFAIEEAV